MRHAANVPAPRLPEEGNHLKNNGKFASIPFTAIEPATISPQFGRRCIPADTVFCRVFG